MTKKECPVCLILNSDPDFSDYINSLLKGDTKIAEVILELTNRNCLAPTEHYLKKHKNNCLKDFNPPQYHKKSNLNDGVEITETNEIIDIDWQNFNSLSSSDKDKKYQEILHRLYYYKLSSLDRQKDKIYKEDIATLKSLNDLLSSNNIDISSINFNLDNVVSCEELELQGLKLINLIVKDGLITRNVCLDIAKLLVTIGSKLETAKNFQDDFNNISQDQLLEKINNLKKSIEDNQSYSLDLKGEK